MFDHSQFVSSLLIVDTLWNAIKGARSDHKRTLLNILGTCFESPSLFSNMAESIELIEKEGLVMRMPTDVFLKYGLLLREIRSSNFKKDTPKPAWDDCRAYMEDQMAKLAASRSSSLLPDDSSGSKASSSADDEISLSGKSTQVDIVSNQPTTEEAGACHLLATTLDKAIPPGCALAMGEGPFKVSCSKNVSNPSTDGQGLSSCAGGDVCSNNTINLGGGDTGNRVLDNTGPSASHQLAMERNVDDVVRDDTDSRPLLANDNTSPSRSTMSSLWCPCCTIL